MQSPTASSLRDRLSHLRNRQRLRTQRSCRRALGCLTLLLIFLFFFGCALLMWGVFAVRGVSAASSRQTDVILVVDQSNSMFDVTDPAGLRFDAAQLLLAFLGAGDAAAKTRVGIITFGTRPTLLAPPRYLVDDAARARLSQLLTDSAEPLGWTNPATALEMAHDQLTPSHAGQQAIILLTDGQLDPDPAGHLNSQDEAARLQSQAEALATDGVTLFVILLSSSNTNGLRWEALALQTPAGRVYQVDDADELIDIYHDIALQLTNTRTLGPVIQATVGAAGIQRTLEIPPHWRAMTLVLARTHPDQRVTLLRPDGQVVQPGDSGIQTTDAGGHELIWTIPQPDPGSWTLRVDGAGPVQVWLDYQTMGITPSPSPTAATRPTATPSRGGATASAVISSLPLVPTRVATQTATPTPTRTPTPTPTETDTPHSLAKPTGSPPSQQAFPARLLWLGLIAPLLAAGAVVLLRRIRGRGPIIHGTLRVVGGPQGTSPHIIVLDTVQKRIITVGPEVDADVALPGAKGSVTFALGPRIGRLHTVLVSGNAATDTDLPLLDDLPLRFPTTINDGMRLVVPPYRLSYENLRLRQALRLRSQDLPSSAPTRRTVP